MADAIRKLILENLEAALEGVTSLKGFGVGTYLASQVERPFASIIPMEEITEFMPDDIYVEKLTVIARVVVDEGLKDAVYQLEDIVADVHRAIIADLKRGGLADDTVKVGTKWLFVDTQHPQAGADITYQILYSTEEKDPSDINFDIS